MDLSAMKDLYIGSTPVQSAWLGGTKVWERTPAVDIQAIKDAMLLWYDLKRQGVTNESMAATPELVNLAYDPDKAHVIDWSEFSTNPGTEAYSITVQSDSYYWLVAQADWHKTHEIPSYYVQVENLPEGAVIYYFYGDGSDERQSYAITYNGLHKLPAGKISPNVNTGTGIFISNENGQTVADVVGTTITQVNPSLNATCYNFAWSGMSSIGGYVYDLIGSTYATVSNNIATIISNEGAIEADIITRTKQINGEKGKTLIYTRKAFDVKVSNLPDGIKLVVNVGKNNGNITEWEMIGQFGNGINHVDEKVFTVEPYDLESTPNIMDCRILFPDELVSVENIADLGITIEILPLYPNTLVSDGVDDYAKVDGVPILTDYTIIAKRKRLDADLNHRGTLASKLKDDTSDDGAFAFEFISADTGERQVLSFGTHTTLQLVDTDISYMTKNSYNGTPIKSGQKQDTNHLTLFSTREYSGCAQAALYSFILFDRTLTEEEINWVKTNLIEGDTEL